MTDDNVIDFKEAKVKLETSIDVRYENQGTGKYCRHKRVDVYEDSRRVECSDCKAPLDAQRVLVQYANEERRFRFTEMQAKQEAKKLTESVESLKAEERRIKARIKRAEETLKKREREIRALPPDELRAAMKALTEDVGS